MIRVFLSVVDLSFIFQQNDWICHVTVYFISALFKTTFLLNLKMQNSANSLRMKTSVDGRNQQYKEHRNFSHSKDNGAFFVLDKTFLRSLHRSLLIHSDLRHSPRNLIMLLILIYRTLLAIFLSNYSVLDNFV